MSRPLQAIDPINVSRMIGRLGGTDEQLAEALGISRRALAYRKKKDAELFHTLKEAKAEADSKVEKALFEKATGYTCNDYHVSQFEGRITLTPVKKHYPPDVTACIFWLKNRKPEALRGRAELKTGQNDQNEVLVAVPPDVLERLRK